MKLPKHSFDDSFYILFWGQFIWRMIIVAQWSDDVVYIAGDEFQGMPRCPALRKRVEISQKRCIVAIGTFPEIEITFCVYIRIVAPIVNFLVYLGFRTGPALMQKPMIAIKICDFQRSIETGCRIKNRQDPFSVRSPIRPILLAVYELSFRSRGERRRKHRNRRNIRPNRLVCAIDPRRNPSVPQAYSVHGYRFPWQINPEWKNRLRKYEFCVPDRKPLFLSESPRSWRISLRSMSCG